MTPFPRAARRSLSAALLPLVLVAPPAAARSPAPVHVEGMVSAADPRAAAAGAEILKAGGSATDAALAVMLALNVVEPQSSGIGGGGFLLRGDARGGVETIDGRERAPAAADGQWFLRDGKPLPFGEVIPGGRSVGVPGALALAAEAHKRYGKLPWARLFQPAIRLARDGFLVTPRLNATLARAARSATFDPDSRALYYTADGSPVAVGTRLKNPALAATLAQVAARGITAFYTGANAAAIAREVSTARVGASPLTEADVAAYRAPLREPLCGMYRQWRICGMGPPSSGATTVYAILKQLERFDLTALGPQSPVAWHLIAESMRLAYADRERYLGDADFVKVPVTGLMDPAYLATRSALIDPAKTLALVSAGTPPGAQRLARADGPPQEEHGTTHFVAVDRWGSAVSYTNTIESAFGSGLMVNGYFLNNELTDFNFAPTTDGKPAANAVAGGKRPRSSMSPTLIYDAAGHLRLAVGAAGGTTIPAQVAKAIIGVLDWNLPAQQAIALPVLYSPGATVFVEKGSAHEALIPALQALGHADVRPREASFKANAVEVVAGKLVGAADPRSEGAAATP
ncbi:gamma-glutamyltransferase [Novosphingobium piscinae]|uniref:Glutathione hydrolase proenzyme n=1 Tax=Novosphingobium piscinae TaxID=1507448 RepID=A0A7X1G239_9SPHN|nr:gamma-glutamyltransferase [Novosphingobium piscinae]MBC2670552.1 gamma-glutamyltransferase [Novosphingobium piscinae]